MTAQSATNDTEKLIAVFAKKGSTIADKTTRKLADGWVTSNASGLLVGFKGNPRVLASINYLRKSATNDRLQRKEWLGHLRAIWKALKGRGFAGNGTVTKEGNVALFDDRKFHRLVVKASQKLFRDRHYSQAIFEACKMLNKTVQGLSKSDLDGKKLMLDVFSVNDPKLKLNPFVTQSDKDEQEGFMHIFAGVMHGIRNPKGHDIINLKDPIRALEYLSLLSLLFRRLDEVKIK
jgi:uncharacterized protein (TIGR02391 family)